MNRRTVLKWLSVMLGSVCAAVVAAPGISYVVSVFRRGPSSESTLKRVIRLNDLRVGEPVMAPVVGSSRDAWTAYSEQTIGRVFLVRRSDENTSEEKCKVDVFSSVCHHLGCAVSIDATGKAFGCPCHNAAFDAQGKKIAEAKLGRPNNTPRDLDALECNLVQDESTGEWWVEVKYEKFELGLTKKVART